MGCLAHGENQRFLADRITLYGRAYATVLRLSVAVIVVVCRRRLYGCIVAKRCVLEQIYY